MLLVSLGESTSQTKDEPEFLIQVTSGNALPAILGESPTNRENNFEDSKVNYYTMIPNLGSTPQFLFKYEVCFSRMYEKHITRRCRPKVLEKSETLAHRNENTVSAS